MTRQTKSDPFDLDSLHGLVATLVLRVGCADSSIVGLLILYIYYIYIKLESHLFLKNFFSLYYCIKQSLSELADSDISVSVRQCLYS